MFFGFAAISLARSQGYIQMVEGERALSLDRHGRKSLGKTVGSLSIQLKCL